MFNSDPSAARPNRPQASSKLLVLSCLMGAATILLALVLMNTFPSSAELADGYFTPVIAFEFASSKADLAFLTGDNPVAVFNRISMDQGHQWDMAFPFAYAGFLALLLLRVPDSGSRTMRLAAALTCLIIPFDIYENTILLALTEALDKGEPVELLLESLLLATWLKWGTIGVSLSCLSLGYHRSQERWSSAVCALAALSVIVCALSGAMPILAELMSALIAFCFVFLAGKVFRQGLQACC